MELDPESQNGEKLITRTEYHTGTIAMTSKAIARRRTAEEEFAPQTQIVYGNLIYRCGNCDS
jgi:cleavage and polyadenylation specificity factor subunit 1